MAYSTHYKALAFIVQVKHLHAWETMAAFDCFEAAHTYGQRCFDANRSLKIDYRMQSRNGRGNWSVRAAWTHAETP